jgi:hypothetical protein
MLAATLASWSAWWDTVPTSFAFLLSLPFAVAVAALLGDFARRCRRGR